MLNEWYCFFCENMSTSVLNSVCNYFMHAPYRGVVGHKYQRFCHSSLFSSQVQEKERKGTIKTRSRPWKWSRPSFFRSVARAGSECCWRAAWYQAWWLGPVFTRRKRRCWTGWCCTNQGAGKYNLLLPLEGMLDSAPENELSCGRSPSCSLSYNSVILLFPWRCKLFFQSPWNLAS